MNYVPGRVNDTLYFDILLKARKLRR